MNPKIRISTTVETRVELTCDQIKEAIKFWLKENHSMYDTGMKIEFSCSHPDEHYGSPELYAAKITIINKS